MAFGAAYAPNFRSVRTIGVDNMHDWFRLVSKSKYTECENADFSGIRKLLDSGRYVVFTGSPCQVKALMNEVGYGYGNLLTVDFLCHGYCRTDVLRSFVDDLQSSREKRIVSLDMRPRHNVKVRCVFEDGSVFEDEGDFQNGSVFKIFLNKANQIDRCRTCGMKHANNVSDITVGDFWEYSQFKDVVGCEFQPWRGTNIVKVNTVHGMEIFKCLASQLEYVEIFKK